MQRRRPFAAKTKTIILPRDLRQTHGPVHRRLRLIHRRHSGKIRPHTDTSYLPLAILLVIVGLTLTFCSTTTLHADNIHPGPESGSIGLSGTMPGSKPTTAATITSPTNQQRFTSTPVTVAGTCQAKMLIEVFKNDIFAGSVICDDSGKYAIDIDLLTGQNVILAKVYNALNQSGPDSTTVTVFYEGTAIQGSPLAPIDFGGTQFLVLTDAVFRGSFPDQAMSMPIEILGGSPPFAINIMWGDDKNSVIPRDNNLNFTATHAYKKAGTYKATLQASDAKGRVAFLRTVVIINGQPAIAMAVNKQSADINKLLVLWPLYASSVAIVISFWLGERREKKILAKHGIMV